MEHRLVYLVRPGKLKIESGQRRYIGQIDIPLHAEGINQAMNLSKHLQNADISTIYCSDLSRSRQTAEVIAACKQIVVISDKKLREINFGGWEGKKINEVARENHKEFRDRGADLSYYCMPGGESYVDCSKRVVAAFHDILQNSKGNILISGHGDVNRLLICHVLGLPVNKLFRIGQRYGCLNIISCANSSFKVELINFVSEKIKL